MLEKGAYVDYPRYSSELVMSYIIGHRTQPAAVLYIRAGARLSALQH